MLHNNVQSGATRAIDLGLLETLVGYGVRRLQLKVFDDFLRSLRPWSMTPARFSALVIIEKNPDLKLTELARVLGVARSGAVTLVDALEEPGYVARHASPTDGRAFGLRITAKGKNALAKMSAAVEAHDRRMTAALSVAERVQLKELLDRVLDSESKWEATEDAR